MSEKTYVIDMERQIAEDKSGSYRDSLCQELSTDRVAVKRALDSGLPPAEYEATNRLLTAIDASMKVVRTLWSTAHAGQS